MRTFTVRRGKFAGEHKIYDTLDEAKTNGLTNIRSPWYDPTVEIGDWVVSDDGYVIQCLHRFKLVNKRHRSGQYTDTFRFPNCTAYAYYDRFKIAHIKNFYAVAAHSSSGKGRLGNTSDLGRYMTTNKKLFVTLVAGGLDPFHAYVKAYSKGAASNIIMQVNKLLNDELVRGALMEAMKPFIKEVEAKIQEKTGHVTLLDFLADEISKLVTNARITSSERRENIKLMISLFGEQLGLTNFKKKDKREIEDATYELVKPPELGKNSEDSN